MEMNKKKVLVSLNYSFFINLLGKHIFKISYSPSAIVIVVYIVYNIANYNV